MLEIRSLSQCTDFEIFRFLTIDLLREYVRNKLKEHTFEFYMLNVLLRLSRQAVGVTYYPHTFSEITSQVSKRRSGPCFPSRVSENEKLGNLSNEEFIAVAIQAIRHVGSTSRYFLKEDELLELIELLLCTEERLGAYTVAAFEPMTLLTHGNERLRLGKYLGMWDWTF